MLIGLYIQLFPSYLKQVMSWFVIKNSDYIANWKYISTSGRETKCTQSHKVFMMHIHFIKITQLLQKDFLLFLSPKCDVSSNVDGGSKKLSFAQEAPATNIELLWRLVRISLLFLMTGQPLRLPHP